MVGMNFSATPQPSTASSTFAVNSNPPSLILDSFAFNDGYLDIQRSGKIFMQCQQSNYAFGGGGTGSLSCYYGDQTIPLSYPLQTMYASFGLNNSFAYAGCSISPAANYAKALLNTLPANTGVIIVPTMNFSNGTNYGFGIAAWLPGATPVTIGSATASLFFQANHVLATALALPGAYLHSHLILVGEYDLANNTMTQDVFSYNLNQFISRLNNSVGSNPVPIVCGNLCQSWTATQTGGTGNFVSSSLMGISSRHILGAFVDSLISIPSGLAGGTLNADSTTLGWTGSTGPNFSAPSCRTLGLNMFNYGYNAVPVKAKSFVTPVITGLAANATSSTNISLTWNASTGASAYDFFVAWYSSSNGVLTLVGTYATSGVNSLVINGLTAGVSYTCTVQALSEWGYSTPVSIVALPGNNGSEISGKLSTFTVSSTLAPSDGSTTITITLTLKNIANQAIIGFNTGALVPISGTSSLFDVTPGVANIGSSKTTNTSGVATWTVVCSNALSTTATATYACVNMGMIVAPVTFTFGNPAVQSGTLSTLVASSTTTPADGVTTMTITATYISLGGTTLGGIAAGQLVVSSGSSSQVYFTPGIMGGPGNSQTANGSGQAIWTLKSGNYIGGNPSLGLSTANIIQTQVINFAAQVAVANVDLIIPMSSATTPNTGVLPSATLGNGTAYAMTAQPSGTPQLKYTSSTINGVTKNWFDTTDIYALGGSHAAMISTTPPSVNFSFSFSCWLKITQLTTNPANNFTVILGQNATGAPSANFHVLYADFNPTTPWAYQGLIANVFTNQLTTPFPNSTFPVGAWHHLVVVYDNTGAGTTNTMKGYMDGNATPIFTATAAQTGSTGGWNPNPVVCNWCWGYAGSNQPSTPYQMADFVAYNIALTPTQVAACYNSNLLSP